MLNLWLKKISFLFWLGQKSLLAYKLRTFFVLMAIAFGISSISIVISSIDGAQKKAVQIVNWFGPDAVFVLGGDIYSRALGQRRYTLSLQDLKAIKEHLPGVYLAVPMRAIHNIQVRYKDKNMQVNAVIGSTAHYADSWNWPLSEGRDLNEDDYKRAKRVALIGANLARFFFPDSNPLGKTLFVQNLPLQVVGVLSERDFSGGSGDINKRLIMPLTTLTKRFNLNRTYYRALRLKFLFPENMQFYAQNLESLLRYTHKLRPEEPNDFTILTAQDILKFLSMLKGGLVLFLGLTACITSIIGGFVLANLFYLNIEERKKEIGLKLALGYPKELILAQVLLEALLLCLWGGLLGLGLGYGLGLLLNKLNLIPLQFSLKTFSLSLVSALAIGIGFSFKPAKTAVNISPLEVLKS